MSPPSAIVIQATFADSAEAQAAADALRDAGNPAPVIDIQHNVFPEARAREARFLWRVLVIVVLWSILGGVVGAAFGWLMTETLGPEGTAGLIVQLVSWIIVGHLIGGMLAGYFVLADRTQSEMPPDRPVSVLTVRDLNRAQAGRIRRLLHSRNPLELRSSEPSARSRSS
jgi:hypothetical protein